MEKGEEEIKQYSWKQYKWKILQTKERNWFVRLLHLGDDPFSKHKVLVQHHNRKFWVNIYLADTKKETNFRINFAVWRKFYRKVEPEGIFKKKEGCRVVGSERR